MNTDDIQDDYYEPYSDKGETEWRRFPLDLKRLGLAYDPYTLTWNTTRVDAFKKALVHFIQQRITDSTVEYKHNRMPDRSYELMVTVNSISLGKLTTEFPISIIMDKECPKNLPQLIANEFKNQLQAG